MRHEEPEMRKQYHFRPSGRGVLAWDVGRLVELTKDFPRIQVPVSAIRELDEAYWFGGEDYKPTCRAVAEHARLIQETDLSYPIILSADGRVMDEWSVLRRGRYEWVRGAAGWRIRRVEVLREEVQSRLRVGLGRSTPAA
jgi:hypothetical protein